MKGGRERWRRNNGKMNVEKPSEGRGKERRDRRQNQEGLGGSSRPLPTWCIDDPAPFTPLLDPLHTVCTLRIAHYCDSHVELLVEVRV